MENQNSAPGDMQGWVHYSTRGAQPRAMALILGRDGLKNTTEKYFVYELDWSYLQGLPVGVLLVLLQYVSAESFVKLLFLSKA